MHVATEPAASEAPSRRERIEAGTVTAGRAHRLIFPRLGPVRPWKVRGEGTCNIDSS
jgi:hypothetical protein